MLSQGTYLNRCERSHSSTTSDAIAGHLMMPIIGVVTTVMISFLVHQQLSNVCSGLTVIDSLKLGDNNPYDKYVV